MSKELLPTDVTVIKDNAFKLIANDWMLVTAGNMESFNTMTANWGAFGELWHKKVCFCFVRPTRYTYEFMEREDVFTLSFFDETYRKALDFCGSHSGKDVDKMAETGLTPVAGESGGIYFEQARIVLVCRTVYFHDINPAHFLDPKINEAYPKKDYHRMYVGEVIRCLMK
jgi:flavin reductase (DIM6/NTAB) family NADH-FMN oxidoreductase RutF